MTFEVLMRIKDPFCSILVIYFRTVCDHLRTDMVCCRGLSRLMQWEAVVGLAASLGAAPLPCAAAMANGSGRLHTAFTAAVFRARHGLMPDAGSVVALRARALVVRANPDPKGGCSWLRWQRPATCLHEMLGD